MTLGKTVVTLILFLDSSTFCRCDIPLLTVFVSLH